MINFVPDGYHMDVDCYMDGSQFEVEKWDYLKRFVRDVETGRVRDFRPTEFSMDFIFSAFKPIRHMISNAVIRDQEFQFVEFIKNTPLLDAHYNHDRHAYLVTLNFRK